MSQSLPRGIQAILYALFNADETIDRGAMRRQIDICVASGVTAIGALGLATEVSKLSERERRELMTSVSEDVGGRLPTYFTIYANSVAEQIAQARHAEQLKASYIILQPPAVGAYAGAEYIRFFGRIADATTLPVAIQNAPAYMGRGLTGEEIRDLVTQHPNVSLLKGEGPVVDIKSVIDITAGRIPVFNGRGGLELTDNWRAGCAGMILAPDTIDRSVAIWKALDDKREGDAERAYADVLPAIVFIMQSVESLICYGKRIFAARAGLSVHDRAPALRPTPMGLAIVKRHAAQLGAYPGG
jgi:4-hydroxy-tetrahydrodipicolinate synthase